MIDGSMGDMPRQMADLAILEDMTVHDSKRRR